MSTPLIVNRAPVAGAVAGVEESSRFSIRSTDGNEISRADLFCHIGSGPAFYQGKMLPEDIDSVDFLFKSLWLNPVGLATCSIELDESLKIVKAGTDNFKGIYEFGGIQSPADPEDVLMVEFTLKMAEVDVAVDPDLWTGVLFGLKNSDTGIHIKFLSAGAVRSIQIHHADLSVTVPPSGTYSVNYDWDQGVFHNYKLLWHPKLDILRLYVSSGLGTTPDTLLIDGKVSDFSALLPPMEIPSIQPIAYFGHAHPAAESTSYWHNAYLYNMVSSPVVTGLNRGEHIGFIKTDDTVGYTPEVLPRQDDQPWNLISGVLVEGFEEVSVDKKLILMKTNPAASFGFYRHEPQVALAPVVYDFELANKIIQLDPVNGQATGIEVYIDDGIRKAVVGFLDIAGTQSIGLLTSDPPHLATSYVVLQTAWSSERSYRLIFDPFGNVSLVVLISAEEGVDESHIVSVPYTTLPVSSLPGPGLGFLHNGQTIAAQTEMWLGRVRYSTNVRLLDGGIAPPSGWAQDGSGEVSTTGVALVLKDNTSGDHFYFKKSEATFDAGDGFFLEFRARINSYIVGETENPIRKVSGIGISIDDGTYQYLLVFADAGPDLGKIIFLAVNSDIEQNLFDIRAGAVETDGTYAQVDWAKFHMYRLEKTVGGQIRLFIDDVDTPDIDFPSLGFMPAASTAAKEIWFGSFLDAHQSESEWQFIRYSFSQGFDIAAYPFLSKNEVLARFDHAFNIIAEGGTI